MYVPCRKKNLTEWRIKWTNSDARCELDSLSLPFPVLLNCQNKYYNESVFTWESFQAQEKEKNKLLNKNTQKYMYIFQFFHDSLHTNEDILDKDNQALDQLRNLVWS